MSTFLRVQTVHFFRPPPPKVYSQNFGAPKQGFHAAHLLCNNKHYPVFEVCYVTNDTLDMYYNLQITVNSVYF